ncbi:MULTISPECIES: rhamnulokinase [unclassified Facklamia]|uniref:rhamnulokinase n=1 Tax=Aerococcaceae TaxID=186827 RepID=UPI0013BCDBDF|nr:MULTISPECIES: rhamnulokinase [unclassified Facklamia]NEW63624.1 rhamnulokinase [Facklamia sp. 252]NEW67095.1 rhamnulokinase [Facklamia sp. 253]QQD66359.1 rhamnulokinase [Aerococcaceae bacterium zg-252]
MSYHVAVDIGASSGRLILANYNESIEFTEVHRFKNGFSYRDGKERWDIQHLCQEVLNGLRKVKELGIDSCTVGIDTWAVDYVLLDEDGALLANPVAYRDSRTQGAIESYTESVSAKTIYEKTGIQFLEFNTLYQLYREEPALLSQADRLLFIPDYIAYFLTGKAVGEVSNVSSSQFLNLRSRDYDHELLVAANVPVTILPTLVESGTVVGPLKQSLSEQAIYPDCTVIAVATHDTASAVVGVPATENSKNWAYLSSGTWSLIGIETTTPINSEAARLANYTNEWGAYGTYRFLKNITGMWSIQEIARMTQYELTYAEMAEAASTVAPFQQFINLNDDRFTNPDNMIEAIRSYCRETNQVVPQTIGELVMAVYSNLALSYVYEIKRIETLSDQTIDTLHIVGGGSNVALLNQLTADLLNRKVIAGPGEGTAYGNILVQMIQQGHFEDVQAAREFLSAKIEVVEYLPQTQYDATILEQFTKEMEKI